MSDSAASLVDPLGRRFPRCKNHAIHGLLFRAPVSRAGNLVCAPNGLCRSVAFHPINVRQSPKRPLPQAASTHFAAIVFRTLGVCLRSARRARRHESDAEIHGAFRCIRGDGVGRRGAGNVSPRTLQRSRLLEVAVAPSHHDAGAGSLD
jgi:hypothetical protein